jgi:hypothetical protein
MDDGGNGEDGGTGNGNGNGNNNGNLNSNIGDPDIDGPCNIVDLVFTLDGSGSMAPERQAMREDVFPAFAQQLINIGDGLDDYRVGVADACAEKANFHTRGEMVADCQFASGQSYMTSDSPNLLQEFECVGDIYVGDFTENGGDGPCDGNVKTDGYDDDEQPASAAAAALEEAGATGLNAGFLRENALLVVVGITDEDEQPNPNTSDGPQEIYNRLVAIKGDVKKMVFLGIGGGAGGCSSNAYGNNGALHAQRLEATTQLFINQERGIWWDMCSNEPLENGLGEAMAIINQACEEFPPPIID